ncbi:MAG: folylpolyglutamate synthase/dihydrofolate synthase family protein, partial [Candidatus Eisenbacteria bacterium]|nr:folylpolyglutamate synthase/dihydrofolate synthase family protein [Candidatus Eisenbacteria bacterium]
MDRQESKVSESYRACIDWLFARHRFTMKPGLERVEWLLGAVGSPHEQFRVVHVGGTNGKGSTSCMIASVLREHDIRVGLYTSPHVVDFTERILIGCEPISQKRVVELVDRLRPAADEMAATFFEIATAVAALHFAEESVDIAVAEVGLGGRLDATNALDSLLSVITGIAVDHSEILGSDIAAIASEKAGIIRELGAVVTGAGGDALDVVRGVAAARKARFVSVLEEAPIEAISTSSNGSVFNLEYDTTSYEALSVAMLGRHQVDNARVAVVALHELDTLGVFSLKESLLRRGLSEACCMGRMQVIDHRPTIVADVAHNPDAAEALLSSLPDVFDYDRLIAVVGIMGDKDMRGFLSAFRDRADIVVLTRPASERAADLETLDSIAEELGLPHRVVPTAGAALESALSEAREGDLVLVTGSHYTVGDILTSLGV